jgi:hypothetical protein
VSRVKRCAVRWDGPPAFGLQHQHHGEHECARPPAHRGLCMCRCSVAHDPAAPADLGEPPKKDPASTTTCGTERAAVSAKREHGAAWSGIGFNTTEGPQ